MLDCSLIVDRTLSSSPSALLVTVFENVRRSIKGMEKKLFEEQHKIAGLILIARRTMELLKTRVEWKREHATILKAMG